MGEPWRVVIDSIGESGARMVKALRAVTGQPETRLAELLFQTPSVLLSGLSQTDARRIDGVLREAGLGTRPVGPEEVIVAGDALHEIAVVASETGRMTDLLRETVHLLGVDVTRARAILCTSPTVLLGKLSLSAAESLQRRLARSGAEVAISRADRACFDVFLGPCSPIERARVRQSLATMCTLPADDPGAPLLAIGLPRARAEELWDRFARTSVPLKIINRDFERFDVRLDAASDTPALREMLVAATGMPVHAAPKVLQRLPVVLKQQIDFAAMEALIARIAALGGRASGHLLCFQTFSLRIDQPGDRAGSLEVVRLLTGRDAGRAAEQFDRRSIEGPLTHPQARWLKAELARVGTDTTRVLR